MPSLFDPITYGSIEAKNRIVLAPLTRGRATKEGVPTELQVEYYAERADIGLLITEATGISREGLGWPYAPGIWSDEQVEHWKPVTKAVHDKGGKIIVQLWHMGRAVHSSVTGLQPVAASPIPFPEPIHTFDGKQAPETPRELTKDDIKRILGDYHKAAKNAIRAGFDGVQIHAANGYLIHVFLSDNSNKRTDEYGGSIENRTRFLKEVVNTVVDAIGPERTGIRFSPNGLIQGTIDSNPEPLYTEVAKFLSEKKIAHVGLRESTATTLFAPTDVPPLHALIQKHFTGKLILNQDYTKETADKAIADGVADAISFGRATISNPDIVAKFKEGKPLKEVNDMPFWYSQGAKGYTELE